MKELPLLIAFLLGFFSFWFANGLNITQINVQPAEVDLTGKTQPIVIYRDGVPDCGLNVEGEPCKQW